MPKQIHLAAHYPGSNNHTVWSDPSAGSYIEFESFARLARTAERGKFDFLFLAEHLRLRQVDGQIFELDVAGRPDSLALFSALSSVTKLLGLVGTYNTTFSEPFELARQLATLDHLSAGRAAGNLVTTARIHGENFRRGNFISEQDGQHYERGKEFLRAMCQMWDGGAADFTHHGKYFDIEGTFSVPTPPQGRPVIMEAGNSDKGRDFAAATADAIFWRGGTFEAGQEFYADIKQRMAKYSRNKDQLKIMGASSFVLGDTDEEAKELNNLVRRQRVSPQYAITMAETAWGRDLSGYDPDGPLPDIEPELGDNGTTRPRAMIAGPDPTKTVRKWREVAKEKNLSLREMIMEVTLPAAFVGSPQTIASEINRFVQSDACDGFILWPPVVPDGLDEFVDKVVPLLVEQGVFRDEYTGTTLREHLGLQPVRPGSN
ncbi:LLM class flavin-dependent oxidoreductase [Streptomyces johnsoniae]|uniref:LLM class flavin-dependent oxidoreductase n=1 Tax=Streptomyces johnsoniae TaxID=3075532 RepID=A0ABU2S3I2_9ACTN|nr:LLM class flavin-dependent oxidoreductase [Streptomyces sp. DSM 41886]MDT0443467.1 LLM class flavin-dependent oxidoreductase [Streptomyces sp. DSM 41886]